MHKNNPKNQLFNHGFVKKPLIFALSFIVLFFSLLANAQVKNKAKIEQNKNEIFLKEIVKKINDFIITNPDSAEKIINIYNEIFEKTDNKSMKASFLRCKGFYHLKSDASTALKYYEQSRAIYRELADSAHANAILSSIGACYMLMGEYPVAK